MALSHLLLWLVVPSTPKSLHLATGWSPFAPVIGGAISFACSDVLTKVALLEGAGVLTVASFRGVVGLALLFVWLRVTSPARPLSHRERWISLGLGVLFAGNVYLLFRSIEVVNVPIAILTYFIYPLLTGIAGAATGLDRLTWRGLVAAIVAFCGLGLMIGAHPTALSVFGIVAAASAALCRVVMLLITRANLQNADPWLTTWYSLISSTMLFGMAALAMLDWQSPASAYGWAVMVALGVAVTGGILGVYASTSRIGPFQTALFMNLEPVLATVGSALLIGEVITPLQAVGGAVMITALVAFQIKR
jgi:drug/metabolite transporter (DMT)-like permease